MEKFSASLALCAGNSPVPVNSPHKGQWRGALMFSLICVWINGWVNNREAGDLRRHRGHYDINVMVLNMFKTVAEGSRRRLVTQRLLWCGRREADIIAWLQNGCTMVSLWSVCNKCILLRKLSLNLGSASAPLLPPCPLTPSHHLN